MLASEAYLTIPWWALIPAGAVIVTVSWHEFAAPEIRRRRQLKRRFKDYRRS